MATDRKATSRDYDVIRRPIMTEKSTGILERTGAYVFIVAKNATKQEIKKAIERVFDVGVLSVNTIVQKGKRVVFRHREGKRAGFKKAIVRLAGNDRIDFGNGVRV
jgi:large subunit ribosomal protein L23